MRNQSSLFGMQESVLLKLLFIALLAILLLIPSAWIDGLIVERSNRQREINQDVSDKWSGTQMIQGPVLLIPYKVRTSHEDINHKVSIQEFTENLYVLPEALKIKAAIQSQTLHRGIFNVGVYNASIQITGNFNKADLSKLQIDPSLIMMDKARLLFSVSDLKGLQSNPIIKVQNQASTAEPVLTNGHLLDNGLQVAVNLANSSSNLIPFSFNLNLKGSQELKFIHTGKTTAVEVSGNWPSPSFDGRYLPDNRQINNKGFTASWRMLYYNRPFPQQWIDNDTLLNNLKNQKNALFGVKLRIPVDEYQKTMRSSKYAILIIALTFVALFLTEVVQKQKVHMLNYTLIGAAMIVFYILLLSFAEQVGFNIAYLIAAIATIALITWFVASLLSHQKAAILFAGILTLFYSFIFIIIQLEDLALLVGSIALFIIIATLMYFSRTIDWNNREQLSEPEVL
ncbi:cell envelope integrity protein CreD [Mucilaginibacter robiniae]|uniref:Cell envelope integrity protein CreD n=1 Tax=Mucilaginibacter robiniae TaxID=2728022 RepID=A0A7L5DXN5_9SPHI|nr:cell envelope integrity protein CreD [Mucilaginibacter robiniae]QJD95775.1 cell envelope integrity protein CreD [Mucilaginibacter robiniae]